MLREIEDSKKVLCIENDIRRIINRYVETHKRKQEKKETQGKVQERREKRETRRFWAAQPSSGKFVFAKSSTVASSPNFDSLFPTHSGMF